MNRDVFVCYSQADRDFAEQLVRNLERQGIYCWLAPRDIPANSPPLEAIARGLKQACVGLVIGSPAAESSSQVLRELEWLVINDRTVFVLPTGKHPLGGLLTEYLKQVRLLPYFSNQKLLTQRVLHELELAGVTSSRPPASAYSGWMGAAHYSRWAPHWLVPATAALLLVGIGIASLYSRPALFVAAPAVAEQQAAKAFLQVVNEESLVRSDPFPAGSAREVRNSIGMKLSLIPSGSFTRRSPFDLKQSFTVTLTKPYYISVTEVTQQQFRELMGESASAHLGDLLPVDAASWNQAVEFCQRLSELPEERAAGRAYRLPTEAEWEFAARGGVGKRYFFGDDPEQLESFAWIGRNSEGETRPVGLKLPNPWGLYDVYGNVAEWCSDWAGDYPLEGCVDPRGPDTGRLRVLRGEKATSSFWGISSAARGAVAPDGAHGFRVVCEVVDWGHSSDADDPLEIRRLGGPVVDTPWLQKAPGSRMENRFDR